MHSKLNNTGMCLFYTKRLVKFFPLVFAICITSAVIYAASSRNIISTEGVSLDKGEVPSIQETLVLSYILTQTLLRRRPTVLLISLFKIRTPILLPGKYLFGGMTRANVSTSRMIFHPVTRLNQQSCKFPWRLGHTPAQQNST